MTKQENMEMVSLVGSGHLSGLCWTASDIKTSETMLSFFFLTMERVYPEKKATPRKPSQQNRKNDGHTAS